MKITIKVMQVSSDTRSVVDSKTGLNRQMKISNVLGSLPSGDILNCRTFSDDYVLPEVGKNCDIVMRRYEKKGMVADVLF